MSIEGQDTIFGQENSVATAQSSSQAQLPESENKLDDSIDNQQQVCLAHVRLRSDRNDCSIIHYLVFMMVLGHGSG